MIEPPAGRNLAAIVKPELLFQAGIHWLTLIDQRDLAGDRNPRAILLPNFGEYLITQCAPHRTNVVEIGQLHAAQVSNLTNKFYKRSQREIFEQEIAENPEKVLLDSERWMRWLSTRGVQAVKIENPSEIFAISLFKIPLRGLQLFTVYRAS